MPVSCYWLDHPCSQRRKTLLRQLKLDRSRNKDKLQRTAARETNPGRAATAADGGTAAIVAVRHSYARYSYSAIAAIRYQSHYSAINRHSERSEKSLLFSRAANRKRKGFLAALGMTSRDRRSKRCALKAKRGAWQLPDLPFRSRHASRRPANGQHRESGVLLKSDPTLSPVESYPSVPHTSRLRLSGRKIKKNFPCGGKSLSRRALQLTGEEHFADVVPAHKTLGRAELTE